ncbi:MAG TPA: hypothetical protein PKD90_17305, partial [Phnomibacter sp.]|nr:hypothetical protein [Phnomibacter sp.]
MKIAVRTRLFAIRNMNINTRHSPQRCTNCSKGLSFDPMGWFRLHRFTVSVFLLWGVAAAVLSPAVAQRRYTLTYHFTPQPPQGIKPRSSFATKQQAAQYVEQLPALLVGAGYWAAAVDSLALDSLQGHATLYTGNQYRWQQLTTDSASRWWLSH